MKYPRKQIYWITKFLRWFKREPKMIRYSALFCSLAAYWIIPLGLGIALLIKVLKSHE